MHSILILLYLRQSAFVYTTPSHSIFLSIYLSLISSTSFLLDCQICFLCIALPCHFCHLQSIHLNFMQISTLSVFIHLSIAFNLFLTLSLYLFGFRYMLHLTFLYLICPPSTYATSLYLYSHLSFLLFLSLSNLSYSPSSNFHPTSFSQPEHKMDGRKEG